MLEAVEAQRRSICPGQLGKPGKSSRRKAILGGKDLFWYPVGGKRCGEHVRVVLRGLKGGRELGLLWELECGVGGVGVTGEVRGGGGCPERPAAT